VLFGQRTVQARITLFQDIEKSGSYQKSSDPVGGPAVYCYLAFLSLRREKN